MRTQIQKLDKRWFNNTQYNKKHNMRTQLDDLQDKIILCQKNKSQAMRDADIKKWRLWEDKEQQTRTLMYNII